MRAFVCVRVKSERWRSRGNFHTFNVLQHRVSAAESFVPVALLMRRIPLSWKHLGLNPFFGRTCSLGWETFPHANESSRVPLLEGGISRVEVCLQLDEIFTPQSQHTPHKDTFTPAKGRSWLTHTVHSFHPSSTPLTPAPSFLVTHKVEEDAGHRVGCLALT